MYRSVYLDREDAKSVEEEERNLFLKGVLEQVGVPLDDVWPDILLTVKQKCLLRDLLGKLEIEIIDDGDRAFTIYHNDTQLGKWNKPKFILREDNKARTLSKRHFFEMVINTWSVFDTKE
ncbi:hypothetical protein M0R72_02590 [Candidatus Pacearchaeota archaeon]|jgi:hypothetical protein|nr:hypothetical protein [Candidatus Pacearchaeota archaeon]